MSLLLDRLDMSLADLEKAGTYKHLKHLDGPMAGQVSLAEAGDALIFCSNNYLGLADHPDVIAAGKRGLDEYGAGTASVRFICGTLTCHREFEEQLARFLGTEAALTYVSCWSANEGLITNLVREGDLVVSDELNHASLIDAIRLSRQATRKIYPHNDLAALEATLAEHPDDTVKVVVTDGVFSMEGDVAPLPDIYELCRKHRATLVVDDSHATGVLGKTGRGTHEHFGLPVRPDGFDYILTGTLGKALGGAAGGYVAGPKPVIDYLVQRSRPQLFSNALPATVACSAGAAVSVLEREPQRVSWLHANVGRMRNGLRRLGFEVLESPTAILPIIVGETAVAIALSKQLLAQGLFVIGFGFPVVPEGKARLRVQMSAGHTDEQIDRALAAFADLRGSMPDMPPRE